MAALTRTLRAHPWAVPVVILGVLLRWWVLRTTHGMLSADETVTGLSTLEVLDGRFRIVIPANAYTATFESFAFAPFLAVFGPGIALLKWLGISVWAAAGVSTILAARTVLDPARSWIAGGIVWLAPGAMMIVSTRAYFGYASGMVAVAATYWALGPLAEAPPGQPDRRRSLIAGFLGGLAFYVHPMYSAVVVPAALVVAARHRRAGRDWWAPAALGAFVANVPVLFWNLRNSFASLHQQNEVPGTYLDRLSGFFTGLLPRDFGVMGADGSWVVGRPIGWLVWFGIPALALAGAIRLARRRTAGRMYLAAIVFCWPIMAVFAPLGQTRDGRYGVIVLPLFAVCLTSAVEAVGETIVERIHVRPVVVAGAIASAAGLLLPYQFDEVTTEFVRPNAGFEELVVRLDAARIEAVKGSYWVVSQASYLTDWRIASAVTDGWPVRYPRSQQRVDATPPEHVAFVFQYDDVNPTALPFPIDDYQRVDLQGLVLLLPPDGDT
ncbi:MAG: hypothetical protein R2715_10355 [Ilumatobacteraceae bacterium]